MDYEQTGQQWSWAEPRIRWSAIFAGLVVGLAVQMMLTLLGLAVGAWAVDFHTSEPAKGIPLGTGIWSGISILIAAFAGGYVAARMAGIAQRMDGIYHGTVVWAVTWLTFAWLATTVLSVMVGGVFSAFGTAVQSLGQGVSNAASRMAAKTNIDLSMDDVRRQVESVLQATGKRELEPGQMQQDAEKIRGQAQGGPSLEQTRDTALNEVREKLAALDRDAAINVMVNKLGMSRSQAEQVAQSTIGLVGRVQQRFQDVKGQSVDVAQTTVERVGSAAGWLFLLALITLAASAGGGAVGSRERSLVLADRGQPDIRRTG